MILLNKGTVFTEENVGTIWLVGNPVSLWVQTPRKQVESGEVAWKCPVRNREAGRASAKRHL